MTRSIDEQIRDQLVFIADTRADLQREIHDLDVIAADLRTTLRDVK